MSIDARGVLLGLVLGGALCGCRQNVELARMRPDAGTVDAGQIAALAGSFSSGPLGGVPGAIDPMQVGRSQDALSVHIEDIQQITIQIVTLACAGDCAEIQAVASGGNPPYSYAWEDGSTDAARRVCLEQSRQLSVSATDTAIAADEFMYTAQRVDTQVSANVLSCTGDDDGLCVENASLEGTPVLGVGTPESVPPGWVVCANTPDIGPSISDVAPSDGQSYLALAVFSTAPETAGGKFCAPLEAGRAHSFLVDLAPSSAFSAGPSKLEIWGAKAPCGMDELLWTSPALTDLDEWKTFCGTLQPTQSFPFVVLVPTAGEVPIGYVLIDNFRPAATCN